MVQAGCGTCGEVYMREVYMREVYMRGVYMRDREAVRNREHSAQRGVPRLPAP